MAHLLAEPSEPFMKTILSKFVKAGGVKRKMRKNGGFKREIPRKETVTEAHVTATIV